MRSGVAQYESLMKLCANILQSQVGDTFIIAMPDKIIRISVSPSAHSAHGNEPHSIIFDEDAV